MNPFNCWSFWSFLSILSCFFQPSYSRVDFFALNGFSTNSSQAVTLETCAYNATNSRLCVKTDIYTFGYSTLVSFDTPSTKLYNMTIAAYYTTQPNILLARSHFEPDYNITSYNVFLALVVYGFTEIKPGVYNLIPDIIGRGGQPMETNTVEFMTIDLFYTTSDFVYTTANIPSFAIYQPDGTVNSINSQQYELLFSDVGSFDASGEGYYLYAQPFNLNWIFPNGAIQAINNSEAHCYAGQLLVNAGIGYIYPNGTSVSSAVLLMPPLQTPSPTITPTMYPTVMMDDNTDDSSSGHSNVFMIIMITFGSVAIILQCYFCYQFNSISKKHTIQDKLIDNQEL